MDELINDPRYVSNIETKPFILFNQFFPGSGGAELTTLPATLTIKMTPGNEVSINKIEFTNKNTNIKDFKIELVKLESGKGTETINGKNIYDPVFVSSTDKIREIIITILSTRNKKNASSVEISVKACLPETTTVSETSSTTKNVQFTAAPIETTTPGQTTASEQTTPKGKIEIKTSINKAFFTSLSF